MNNDTAVIIEPILLCSRAKKTEGVVTLALPGWERPITAQVIIVAFVAGLIRILPVMWRLVDFAAWKSPSIQEVRNQCALEITKMATDLHSMNPFHMDKRLVAIQGSDLVDFSILVRLHAAKIPALITLPECAEVEPADSRVFPWFTGAVPKHHTTGTNSLRAGELAKKLSGSAAVLPFVSAAYGRQLGRLRLKRVWRANGDSCEPLASTKVLDFVGGGLDTFNGTTKQVISHHSLVLSHQKLSLLDLQLVHHYSLRARGVLILMERRFGLSHYQGNTWGARQKHLTFVGCAWALAQAHGDYRLGVAQRDLLPVKLGWERRLESPFMGPLSTAPMSDEDARALAGVRKSQLSAIETIHQPTIMLPNQPLPIEVIRTAVDWEEIAELMRWARAKPTKQEEDAGPNCDFTVNS
ncbi:MAG: hypothetical protein ACLQVY_01350 [Limisphaerales bacterium]